MLIESRAKRAVELRINPSMLLELRSSSSLDDLKVIARDGLPSSSYSISGSCQRPVATASWTAL